MIDNEFRISRLIRIYLKSASAGSPNVRPYGEWPEETKQLVQNESGVTAGDSPFLMYYRASSEWTLVTLVEVVWKLDGHHHHLSIDDISQINCTDAAWAAMKREMAVLERERNESLWRAGLPTKGSMTELQCISESGETFQIKWDPGGAFFGLWNMLRVMPGQSPSDRQ